MSVVSLESTNCALLVIDMQGKLLPVIVDGQACVGAARKMVEAARVLGLAVMATEQYPAGLGPTCPVIKQALGDSPVIEKVRFSACVEPVTKWLSGQKRPMVIIVGIEAHVCVQQTVMDLLRLGYTPVVCADAVSSRRGLDREMALARMRQAGAVVTTIESVIFELVGQAGTESFKRILKIVK